MATLQQSQPAPTCPVCEGTGWKRVVVPGKADRVTRCDCYFADRGARLLKGAQIPARYTNCTLSNFDIVNQSLSSAVSDIQHFVTYYPLENAGLLLVGPIGVGKTHLAVAAIQYLIREKGVACLFCDYRELLKQIQNSYNASVQTTELEILRPVFDAEVLVLDELGAIRPSEWVWDTVSHIINYRYNEKKTTIITTNLIDAPSRKEQETEKFDLSSRQKREAELAVREDTLGDRITDRMYSRLHEMCRIIHMNGIDFRRLSSAFILQVIRHKTQPTSELFASLEARSLERGTRWSTPILPWEQISEYLLQLGQTKFQIEGIRSALLNEQTAEIGGPSRPFLVTDQHLRKMQMKPAAST